MDSERDREARKRNEGQDRAAAGPSSEENRIDRVGRSGVYPVSGPEAPSDDAPVHGEMSWGQGERGAEGYYDHGGSELTTIGGEKAIGGATAGPSGEPTGEENLVSDISPEEEGS